MRISNPLIYLCIGAPPVRRRTLKSVPLHRSVHLDVPAPLVALAPRLPYHFHAFHIFPATTHQFFASVATDPVAVARGRSYKEGSPYENNVDGEK